MRPASRTSSETREKKISAPSTPTMSMRRPSTTKGQTGPGGSGRDGLQAFPILPENKQGKQRNEDSVLEIGIAGGADPLQNQAGKNRGIKPSHQEKHRYRLPTGQW